jgi:hypothetical protein
MPELPEVETIIRRLRDGADEQPSVRDQTIQAVEVTWDRSIAEPDALTFQLALTGKQITDARRRGKFLHFPLNQGHLIGHLRMSGDMRMERRQDVDGNPAHLAPTTGSSSTLNRHTGWCSVISVNLGVCGTSKIPKLCLAPWPGALGPRIYTKSSIRNAASACPLYQAPAAGSVLHRRPG